MLQIRRAGRRSLLLSTAALTLIAGPAFAQEAGSPDPAGTLLGEVVITARKRTETALEVPIAVSAFNEARIRDRLIENIVDLSDFTPGLQVQEAFGRSGDRPVIRGASNILVSDGKVGIYIDGAPYLGDFSALDLANVERVEVIKGPQSAVYGRGSLSGAINVVLQRPGDYLKGDAALTYGSFGRKEFSASISTPVNSWFGLQAGAKYYDIDGQFDNTAVPGEKLGAQETQQYTVGLFFEPMKDVTAKVRWLHQTDDDGAYAIALQPSTFNNCFLSTRPYYCGAVNPPKSFALNTDRLQRPGLYRNADRFYGDAAWDIMGSGYELSFQTSYADQIEVVGQDQSYDGREFYLLGSPFVCQNYVPIGNQLCTQSGFNTTDGKHRETETYELRLSSPSDQAFRFRIGGFMSWDTITPMKKYLEASELGLDMLGDRKRVFNRAIFGGVEYDVNERLTIGAELRHQIDEVRATTLSYRAGDVFSTAYLDALTLPNPNQIIGAPLAREATFRATLPRVTVNYRIDNRLSLYAQYSQGNSPGGFNPVAAPTSTFKEEKLINYEIGLKTTRWGFDYLNLSLFWQDYRNQVLTNTYQTATTIDSYSVNIGRTRIRGAELEGAYSLIPDALRVQFNYTYLDAEIRKGYEPEQAVLLLGRACKSGTATNLDLPGCRQAASVAGNRPPLVSDHTGSVGLRYNRDLTDDYGLFAGADVIYRSSFYDQVMNLAKTGASTRVNLQLGVQDQNGLRVTFWGKNVFKDETPVGILRYVDLGPGVAKAPSGDSARAFAITPARPREWGFTVAKSF
jgi:outer membrane receptor protein involved in Fe transport